MNCIYYCYLLFLLMLYFLEHINYLCFVLINYYVPIFQCLVCAKLSLLASICRITNDAISLTIETYAY